CQPSGMGIPMASAGFGTQAPADGEEVAPQVLVLPMLGFDRAGNRLGYGAGHYDRSLDGLRAKGPRIVIGYAFAAQEFPQLPAEATDQPLDLIVTDRELIRPSA
ncbi:MAG: 5-formyltetrahydrofolate cyclo-ligase, partial [Mangrovicoccus sp.]